MQPTARVSRTATGLPADDGLERFFEIADRRLRAIHPKLDKAIVDAAAIHHWRLGIEHRDFRTNVTPVCWTSSCAVSRTASDQ